MTLVLPARRSINTHLIIGLAMSGVMVLGAGGWAVTTEIAGAVVAPGMIVIQGDAKQVQHPTGGVVGAINVNDGDRVKAGDILVSLDATIARSQLGLLTKGINGFAAKQARLEAERDGMDKIDYPADLLAQKDDPDTASAISAEEHLFTSRRDVRESQKAQLAERIAQMNNQADGLQVQLAAGTDEINLVENQLEDAKSLYSKKLVPIAKVNDLQRDEIKLRAANGQIMSELAQVKGRIAETQLQVIQVDQDMRSEVTRDLGQVRDNITQLSERAISARDQLDRIDIRAPISGIVNGLLVHTIGGVVDPSKPLMQIVPDNANLEVESRIATNDRDQVYVNQPVELRFSAFSQRTTPQIRGEVELISAEQATDANTGAHFYLIRTKILPGEVNKLGNVTLTPGMPVETFVQTETRSVFSYLTKPFQDYFARTFRTE